MRTHLLATTVVDLADRKAHWAKKFLAQQSSRLRLLAVAVALALVPSLNDALAQAITIPAGGNVTLPSGAFPTGIFNSTAGAGGGGAINNSGTLTVTGNPIFTFMGNNTVLGNGGAILNQSSGVLNLNGTDFVNNSAVGQFFAERSGGAIENGAGGSVTISNSTFSGNIANGNGGAIHTSVGTVTITDSSFVRNSSVGNGFGGRRGSSAARFTLTVHSF